MASRRSSKPPADRSWSAGAPGASAAIRTARPSPVAWRDLMLSELVAVWLLRRGFEAGAGATACTARRVFGPARSPQALRALERLAAALHRSPLGEPVVHPLAVPSLAPGEIDLLAVLAHAQRAGDARALVERWGWPAAGDSEPVSEALTVMARLLRAGGQDLPAALARPMLGSRAVETAAELDWRERLLLEAIRLWVALLDRGEEGTGPLARLLTTRRLAAVAVPLDAVLRDTAVAATRCVDVRHRGCVGVSPDEARMLHAVSAAPRGRHDVVRALLASWMDPAAARLTAPAVEGIARALETAFHRLPLRDWRFPELDGELPRCGRGSGTAPTLH